MTRFNTTHFTYGSPGQFEHFLPSDFFNWTKITFMPSVIAHVPLFNLEVCPNILEKFHQEQKLQNYGAEKCSQINNRNFKFHIVISNENMSSEKPFVSAVDQNHSYRISRPFS